jgi:transcriptional regulator with XRE-family HTH domain
MNDQKIDFMNWLNDEVSRRGREEAVAALLQEMRIEEQLADLRRRRGMTQAQLAEKMGVKQPLVARLEVGGSKNLTLKTIMKAAVVLGADVEFRIRPRKTTAMGRKKLRTGKRLS